jgi:hypothetical protein
VKRLKSVGVKSVALVSLVLGAVAGFLYGLIILIVAIKDGQAGEGFFSLLLAPIVMAVASALSNALMALIYNRLAPKVGGIEVEIE